MTEVSRLQGDDTGTQLVLLKPAPFSPQNPQGMIQGCGKAGHDSIDGQETSCVPVSFPHNVFGDVIGVRLPDGAGARWKADGTFIGFLERYTPRP